MKPARIIILLAAILWTTAALAGPGKIAGTVLDKNGDAIIGAAVQIEGTMRGAVVDFEGNYFITGVEVGSYTLKISSIGYADQTFNNVIVTSDNTTTLNATLTEEALGLEEQVIEWEPPPVKLDVVSKENVIRKEDLEVRATTSLTSLLSKEPGFKVDPEGALHVRGGREHEALVLVDGQQFRDPLVNSSRRLVNFSALNVEEITVLTGGDASYGGFQSALINVTTPEGSMEKYSGTFEWRTDRVFKTYSFDADQYDYSLSGPVPLADKLFGRNKLSFFFSGMARLSNTYTPYNVHRSPNDYLGLGLDVTERQANDYTSFWKFTYQVDPSKKMNVSYTRDFYLWDIYPDGEAAIAGDYGWQYKYDVANRPYAKNLRESINLEFTHNVSKSTLYEVNIGNFITETKIRPRGKDPDEFTLRDEAEDYDRRLFNDPNRDSDQNGLLDGYWDANANGQYDGEGEGYMDYNQNGQWDRGEDWVDINANGIYDEAEPWVDVTDPYTGANNPGVYDPWDRFDDLNGNGRWDGAEPQLSEQDWNQNGVWDGEPFVDANGNGQYDGWGEGYEDKNRNGTIDRQELYDNDDEIFGEQFVDGDRWFDTGEPFIDTPDENGFYNGVWDAGEIWLDLPSSFTGNIYVPRQTPSTNGLYDAPNGVFDEYELFTYPANLTFAMDPRFPVLYTWADLRQGLPSGSPPWMNMGYDEDNNPYYLHYDPEHSTWDNITRHDTQNPIFNIPDGQWQAEAESFIDYNGNGTVDFLADNFLNPGQWDASAFWMDRSAEEWSVTADVTSQVNKHHELKSGVEFRYRILEMASIQGPDEVYDNEDVPLPEGSPFPGRGAIRDFYKQTPYEGAVYFQDKMEFEGLIVRAGLRTDFLIHSNDLLEEFQKTVDSNQPGALLAERGNFVLAPRLGISHPVSMKSKLYFNYGHYYQTPSYEYFFKSATANISPNTTIGNPNLEYEKTVSYEVGVSTEFTEDWVLDVAGYYRDVYNQIGTIEERVGPITMNRYFNLGYARARGVEFSLEKDFSRMWALTFNYDYSYALGKESAALDGLTQRIEGVPENRDEHPMTWDQRHKVTAYLTLMIGQKDHPKPLGIPLPNDWMSTVEYSYTTGSPYTPSHWVEEIDENLILTNSARLPHQHTTDFKFDKFWRLGNGLTLATGMEIYNVLNYTPPRGVFGDTGNSHDSSHEDDPDEIPDNNEGKDYDHNPHNYYSPRQIYLHFKLSF